MPPAAATGGILAMCYCNKPDAETIALASSCSCVVSSEPRASIQDLGINVPSRARGKQSARGRAKETRGQLRDGRGDGQEASPTLTDYSRLHACVLKFTAGHSGILNEMI